MISDLLICGKKAASESEARNVMARAIGLTDIDGVPFRTLTPENFHFNTSTPAAGTRRLRESLKIQYLEAHGRFSLSHAFWYASTQRMRMLCREALKNAASGRWNPESYVLRRYGFGYCAQYYESLRYRNPVLAFTVIPGEERIKETIGTGLSIDRKKAEAFPGGNPQWRFFLWAHEMAHGLGADEPRADLVAAVLCRKIFADTAFLAPWADYRAVEAFKARHVESARQYGWAMVEAMDRAIAMDSRQIEAMDEQDVLALRFEKFGTNDPAPVQRLGNRMESRAFSLGAVEGFNLNDPCTLRAAREIGEETSDGNERRIADQFLRAVRRLMIDPSAYTQKVNTFVPERAYG